MAEIRNYPFLRHLRSNDTAWIRHTTAGRLRHDGTGAAFWFRPLSATLSEVPVDDRELPLLVHTRTSDHQDVAVQTTLTYRFADPDAAASRIDFSIDARTGAWVATPLETVASLLGELAQQHAVATIARRTLAQTLLDGIDAVRNQIWAGLQDEPRLAGTGIAVLGVRVVKLSLERDVERALQATERERIQGEADRAGFQRRAQAVDQERAIAENELANQIELARREEDLVTRRGATERRRAAEQAAAEQIAVEASITRRDLEQTAQAERTRIAAQAKADQTRVTAQAQAAADRVTGAVTAELEREHYAVLAQAGPQLLTALAARELAAALGTVEQVTITPDLLTQWVSRLAVGEPDGIGPPLDPPAGGVVPARTDRP